MALVISRKPGESFTVGDNIKITITKIRGCQALVLIDAPKELAIKRDDMRKEVAANGK